MVTPASRGSRSIGRQASLEIPSPKLPVLRSHAPLGVPAWWKQVEMMRRCGTTSVLRGADSPPRYHRETRGYLDRVLSREGPGELWVRSGALRRLAPLPLEYSAT